MHPILFKIPLPHWKLPYIGELHAFPIYSYGVMLGLSLIVGWYLSLTLAKNDGLPREAMANNYIFTAILAIVGSRLLYVVTNLDEMKTWKEIFAIRSGGLVAYGGFLGGFLGSWIYCARKKIRLMAWADVAVPALASGLMITRIGCYLFGCDFGKPLSEKAPAFLKKLGTFPEWHYDYVTGRFLEPGSEELYKASMEKGRNILPGSPAWVQHSQANLLPVDAHHSLAVHPTQLYESLCGLLLLGMLFWARRDIKRREAAGKPFFRGELFVVFAFGYGVLRFLLEMVRDDAERGQYGPAFEPHVIFPIALMVMALAFVFGLSNIFTEKNNVRTIVRSIAILIPFGVFLAMKPAQYQLAPPVQLSTSQWVAIITGALAAAWYRIGHDSAHADPVAAADLGEGVQDLLDAEAAAEEGGSTESEEETSEEESEEEEEAAPKKASTAKKGAASEESETSENSEEAAEEKPAAKKQPSDENADAEAGTKPSDEQTTVEIPVQKKAADEKKAAPKEEEEKA
jgi:phosphatidylglycerol:prolipoprotein diacylglycerol transferase